jgi:hypothetical protein
MLGNVSPSAFLNSQEVNLLPVVSAEWNQNLFNSPYVTVAGTGLKKTISANSTLPAKTSGTYANKYFDTYSFSLSNGSGSVAWTATSLNAPAYKVITYMMTDNSIPVIGNIYAQGLSNQFGSASVEINNYGWTKVEVFVGGQGSSDPISSFVLTLSVNALSATGVNPTVYYTVPEVYETQYFNYQYNSLWPTDSVFSYFRPGDSYVTSGNSAISAPARRIASKVLNSETLSNGFYGNKNSPVTPILQNPNFTFAKQYVPFMKNVVPTDIAPYKYFVSDPGSYSGLIYNPSITGIYPQSISTNKIVVKFNTLVTVPTISIYLNGSGTATYSGAVPSNGVLVLYYNGTSWSQTQWSTMPAFNESNGSLSPYTTINKITITQTNVSINSQFNSLTNSTFLSDSNRMHLVEVSPRLEIDLSSYVEDVQINKALDSKSTVVPLSTLNTDDVSLTLAGMPAFDGTTIVPLFSNQSNSSASVLANMLRKNIKFYIGWNLLSYGSPGSYISANTYIPSGVFYSDHWDETDIESIKIQAFDSIRYLQTLPVPDYVANLKTVLEVISNVLDMAGYTDYDYDSLYTVCNDPSLPMDLTYFFANSQDKTVAAFLTEIFLAYQIGCYIDEYGIMKFLSLANILSSSTSNAVMSLTQDHVEEGGYGVTNSGKVGKISLRYQSPKIKQSLALQNATDPTQKNSPSFIYTTSNAQLWISGSTDAVGFNYLNENMSSTASKFKLNTNDLLDIFHTFNLNTNGYVAIENEIVSFAYKDYTLSNALGSTTVSVKSDLELASEVNKFSKMYQSGLIANTANITNISANGTTLTITASNNFSAGQSVSIDGASPVSFNIMGTIASASSSSFTVVSQQAITDTYSGGGTATVSGSYDVTVTPTGYISNVQRGLFGTAPSNHSVLQALSNKNLSQANLSGTTVTTAGATNASVGTINPISTNPGLSVVNITCPVNTKVLLYPSNQTDQGFKTYSTKFNINNNSAFAGGIFFNMDSSMTTSNGAYFVEFIQNQTGTQSTSIANADGTTSTNTTPIYQYLLAVYQNGTVISWSDITGMATNIISNFEGVLVKNNGTIPYTYTASKDAAFQLKVVHYASDGTDGESVGEVLSVYLNNYKVVGWQVLDSGSGPLKTGWKQAALNAVTGIPQNPLLSGAITTGSQFGAYMSTAPVAISGISYVTQSSTVLAGSIRELYATQKPLKERSTNYWHTDPQFLTGLVQNQKIFSQYKSYMMQTQPSAIGINVYDVQYQNPAATNVDILPIQYYMTYFPGNSPIDNSYKQELLVDEYALSYSAPVHTGFRAKFAIANNSPYMVFIHHVPDELNTTTTQLVLWTHEIVAPSDPEIIEKVINQSNATEVAQIDSTWIQSRSAANRMIGVIEKAIEGFSKDTTLNVFGNPLIQLGDIITLTYPLTGIQNQAYVVQSVKHTFNQGLTTQLMLNQVGIGTSY